MDVGVLVGHRSRAISRGRVLAMFLVVLMVVASLVALPRESYAAVTTFGEVSATVGINFTHSAGSVCDPPIGSGSAWADYDGDGDIDLYLTNRGGANAMYENMGDTNGDGMPDFVDNAVVIGIDEAAAASLSSVFIDYDNDGDQDLFVTNLDSNTLWNNVGDTNGNGNPNFTDVTATAGLADFGRAITASWADYDNDSFLDLYVAKHIRCVGGSSENAEDHLFHNNGNGTFTDVTTILCGGAPAPCSNTLGLGFSAGWVDYDNDGDQDLYLVNDNIGGTHQKNKLWRNDGAGGAAGWIFTEVSAAAGADTNVNGMGLGIGDYDNNGYFDFAFSNVAPGKLLKNNGNGTFSDVSTASGVTSATTGETTWGTLFFDYNNDGWEDLYYVAGAIGVGGQPNVLVENNKNGTFTDISVASGLADSWRGRNASMVDFDKDGWVDILLNNYDGPTTLYRNLAGQQGNTFKSISVTVEGVQSNRDGIGTRLELTAGGVTQIRQITSGPTHGGGDHRAAYFGIGSSAASTLVVKWPNGVVQNVGVVNAGARLHLVEPVGSPTTGTLAAHVFNDTNGNAIEDATETGLGGVLITATDANGLVKSGTTGSTGDASISGLAPGTATVVYTTPANATLTTGNSTQTATVVAGATVVLTEVGYQTSGTPPAIIGVDNGDKKIDPGVTKSFRLSVSNVQSGATWAFSGTGLTVTDVTFPASGKARITVAATTTAESGFRSLTVTNPDGLSGTLDSAIEVTGSVPPPGSPPVINFIDNGDKTINQGATKSFRVDVSNAVAGAVWTVSGTGVTVTSSTAGTTNKARVTMMATATAATGFRNLTITNPDGQSSTLINAIEVLPSAAGNPMQ